MQLFELFGSIMVDNKKANESIHKTDSLASKLGKGLGNGIKTAAKWGAAIGAGAMAAGAALMGVAKKAADTGDRVDKLSQKIGLSRTGFQEWEYILSQNGTSIEVLQGGMKKMNKVLDDAKGGSERAAEMFGRVGLSLSDIQDMNPEQAFEATVKALQGMPEGAEKAALANELLGRSGSELMPLLNGSADSVEELRKQAHDLGIVLSDDAVDASALFTDTLDNLQRSFTAVVTKVGVAVMPIMQQFADWILANMPTIQAVFNTVFNAIQIAVTVVVDVFKKYFIPALTTVKDWVVKNWPTIKKVTEEVFKGIQQALKIFVDAFKLVWSVFGEYITKYITVVFNNIKNLIQSVMKIIRGIIDTITALISGDWKGAWEGIKKITEGVWNAIKTVINTLLESLKLIIKVAWDFIKGITSSIWNGIKSVITGVWESIKSAVSSAVNSVKSTVSNVFNALKNTVSNIWNGIKNAIMTPINAAKNGVAAVINGMKSLFNFTWKWPRIPLPHFSFTGSINPFSDNFPPKVSVAWYAKGGYMDKATIFGGAGNTLFGGGEAGGEGIVPLQGRHMYPLADAMADRLNSIDNMSEKRLDEIVRLMSIMVDMMKSTDIQWNDRELGRLVRKFV